jgi:hypothetical protein
MPNVSEIEEALERINDLNKLLTFGFTYHILVAYHHRNH